MQRKLFPNEPEHLVSMDRAQELTRPLWQDFSSVWSFAWGEWGSLSELHRAMLLQTQFIPPIMAFGFAQARAKELFNGREAEGITPCLALNGVVGFYIQNEILIRFNAVSRYEHVVRGMNKRSDRKDRYYRQEPLDGLINTATRLTVGCVVGATRTEVAHVVVSCQVGEERLFSFYIDGSEEATVGIPTPIISPEPPPVGTDLVKKKPR
jgi:hypothetical protein